MPLIRPEIEEILTFDYKLYKHDRCYPLVFECGEIKIKAYKRGTLDVFVPGKARYDIDLNFFEKLFLKIFIFKKFRQQRKENSKAKREEKIRERQAKEKQDKLKLAEICEHSFNRRLKEIQKTNLALLSSHSFIATFLIENPEILQFIENRYK